MRKAVVSNGGLSLIGEAVYLGKPVYSVPVKHQFEQIMNARYLEELGYGLNAESIDGDLLRMFLREQSRYAARVAKHKQDGNEVLFATVDKLVKQLGKRAAKKRKKTMARWRCSLNPPWKWSTTLAPSMAVHSATANHCRSRRASGCCFIS